MSFPHLNSPVAFYHMQNKIPYLILVYVLFIIWPLALSPNSFPCFLTLYWLPCCYLKIISHTCSKLRTFPMQFPLFFQVFQWVVLSLTQLRCHLSEKRSLFYLKQNPYYSIFLYYFIFFSKHLLLPYIVLQIYLLTFLPFVSYSQI